MLIKPIKIKKRKQRLFNKFRRKPKSYKFKRKLISLIILFLSLLLIGIILLRVTMPNRNKIPIAFSLNNNYIYPLIVLLTSILYNASPRTYYIFYLLLNPDLIQSNINKILGIKEKYSNCKINLIHMGKKFSNFSFNRYKSAAVYYRLELSDLITDFDKIIYLDVDTIVHKDLTDMYNIDMGDNYYMGFPDNDILHFKFNGRRNFINSGVLLINLKKLRKVNAPQLFQEYYKKHGTKKVDEYLINAVFYDKISFLPFIYGIPDFGAGSGISSTPSNLARRFQRYVNVTTSEMKYSSENRAITHNCYELKKWWQRKYNKLTDIGKQWLFYASKSNVFDDICQKYDQFKSQCEKLRKQGNQLFF